VTSGEIRESSGGEAAAGIDFDSSPMSYPGSPTFESELVLPESAHEHPLRLHPRRRIGQARSSRCERCRSNDPPRNWSLNYELLQRNVASVDNRFPVVAVGSNASPSVMRGKMERAGIDGVLPLVRASIENLEIGHSAHVSRPGFVPAAPFHTPGGGATVVVGWLDPEQLQYLDKSEPNYTRVLLAGTDYPLKLEHGERLGHFYIYESKWGLLAEGGAALRFIEQRLLSDWLRAEKLLPWSQLEAEDAVRAFAASEDKRKEARQTLAARGYVRSSELTTILRDEDLSYSQIESNWDEVIDDPLSFRCVATEGTLQRNGQQCVVLNPQDVPTGISGVVLVRPGFDPERPGAPARLIRENLQTRGTIGVDQVLRNALGVEIGERVLSGPAIGNENAIADFLFARPHYVMCRVQSADLATVEQNVALMSPTALRLLGVPGGARVVVEGCTNPANVLQVVRLTALELSDETLERRRDLSGGDFAARFPSSRDALAVFPDLPWIFLDYAERTALGLGHSKLAVVRVRASRRDQMIAEVRELLLLFVLAAVGLAALIKSPVLVGGLLAVLVVIGLLVARARLRRRLEGSRTLTRSARR
jgi:hypothetical protein